MFGSPLALGSDGRGFVRTTCRTARQREPASGGWHRAKESILRYLGPRSLHLPAPPVREAQTHHYYRGMTGTRTHRYRMTNRWTGNLGSGTSAYSAYSRNHELSAEGKSAPISGS